MCRKCSQSGDFPVKHIWKMRRHIVFYSGSHTSILCIDWNCVLQNYRRYFTVNLFQNHNQLNIFSQPLCVRNDTYIVRWYKQQIVNLTHKDKIWEHYIRLQKLCITVCFRVLQPKHKKFIFSVVSWIINLCLIFLTNFTRNFTLHKFDDHINCIFPLWRAGVKHFHRLLFKDFVFVKYLIVRHTHIIVRL